MNTSKRIATLLVTCMLATAAPTAASAASIEIPASVKPALDKTTASADRTLAGQIRTMYNELLVLQAQDQSWDEKIKAISYKNEEALLVLRKQIKQIDADKLSKLEIQVKQTRERYKPLFALYDSLNQQTAIAKSLGNKDLYALLRMKADGMKAAVQLARLDMRTKESSLKTAKDSAAKTMKKIRETLADIDPIKVQIKAERSAANMSKKRLSSAWAIFKQTVKKGDAKGTLNSLADSVAHLRQIVLHKQKIHALEKKISDILLKAKGQIPPK